MSDEQAIYRDVPEMTKFEREFANGLRSQWREFAYHLLEFVALTGAMLALAALWVIMEALSK